LSTNGLTAVKISKKSTNAIVEVNGQTVNLNDGTSNDYVTLTPPAGATSFSFVVRRANLTQGVTVPVIAVDTCGGDWRTFVGAGTDAFR
jgi:UDP-3-O-acyl-N-acetylglucosamine deacetylase